jgi:DNA polymerase-3 subunit alpha
MEKEMTGVYISGHPLDEYADLLNKMECNTAFVAELSDRPDKGQSLDGMTVRMGGILTEAKGKATKKGAFMGFVTLEDLTGQIEGLVFPKVYEKYGALLHTDELVILTGKLSIREDEETKILVDNVTLLVPEAEEAAPKSAAVPALQAPVLTDAQLAKEAPLKLYLRGTRDQMESVKPILGSYPGPVPVYFHIPGERITLLTPRPLWCDGDEPVQQELEKLLGMGNIKAVL